MSKLGGVQLRSFSMEHNITEVMTGLIIQIGVIIFAVRFLGKLAEKFSIPSVIGELLAGVIIGPFVLGGIPFPGFPEGLFPVYSSSLAVTPELYGFAMVASIILLFNSGLETDLGLFLRYSLAGGIIGIFGVVFAYLFGAGTCMIILDTGIMDPRCMFFGIMSTATSVGITARILSDKKKMDSPEGVTTLAAAVFDDVLGIVLLAVVMGVVAVVNGKNDTAIDAASIYSIAGRAFGIWLGFSAVALAFSKQIARFLKLFHNSYDFSICALGLALLLAGAFEKQGLAMIIGAYITGLSLSSTDIAPIIREKLEAVSEFFVPLFFCVMGMMVNVSKLMDKEILIFGAIYTLACIFSKVVGCGLPALFLGFNIRGALRIGCGMVPRGEVALIIAGIGITSGILDEQLFGVVIMMTLITTIFAPPALSAVINSPKKGTNKEIKAETTVSSVWEFKSEEIADLVAYMYLKDLRKEGFFVFTVDSDAGVSQARINKTVITIIQQGRTITAKTTALNMGFVKTSMYEVLLRFNDSDGQGNSSSFVEVKKDMVECAKESAFDLSILKNKISEKTIITGIKSDTQEDILKELVMVMCNTGQVQDWKLLYNDIMLREKLFGTGMENGIAFPHARTAGVKSLCIAIGVKKTGVDFGAMDGKPSRVFVMIASPKDTSAPHIQVLASFSTILREKETVDRILNASTPAEVAAIFNESINGK